MARRSLRPHLNQIRTWVRQGRTDAWIAHQLEVTVQQIEAFKREQGLAPDEEGDGAAAGTDFDDEIDLRAEDDALIAAELEAAEAEAEESEDEEDEDEAEDEAADSDNGDGEPRRRRSRRGGRRRRGGGRARRGGQALEGTFDHGEEGYGLWLDPAVQDDPVYAEHWAGHRPVTVTIEEEQIVIRRAGDDNDGDDNDEGS
jgi:hypothetical protein